MFVIYSDIYLYVDICKQQMYIYIHISVFVRYLYMYMSVLCHQKNIPNETAHFQPAQLGGYETESYINPPGGNPTKRSN